MKLTQKVAIVTGAGAGIGRATAQALAGEGAGIVAVDIYLEAVQHTAAAIEAAGGNAIAVQADVSDLSSHSRIVAAAQSSFGRLDVLINNAGIQERRPFPEMDEALWDRIIGVNLKGPFFLAQKAAEVMTGGASIINLASVQDDWPLRNNSIYGISKGGMRMLTKCLALELAGRGIRVNAVSPGAIATPMNQGLLDDTSARAQMEQSIPLGRLGEPEEIARAIVFLASDDASYATGSTLYVDGGLLLE